MDRNTVLFLALVKSSFYRTGIIKLNNTRIIFGGPKHERFAFNRVTNSYAGQANLNKNICTCTLQYNYWHEFSSNYP